MAPPPPPSSTHFADVRRLVSSGAPPALIVSDPAWMRMLDEIDAGLARRKETIDRVAADLGVMLEDRQKVPVPPAGPPLPGPDDGWWAQGPPMPGYAPPWGCPQGYPPHHAPPPYHMASPPPPMADQGAPVPPPFPTPPPGFNQPYQTNGQQSSGETELQRRKRQALERMATPPAENSVERRPPADAGYGPAPDPSNKEAFEAYRRACWLKYYQHMAALQTPGQPAEQSQQQQKQSSSAAAPIPNTDDDEDDDINKELLGL
ncbi:hypothetical protein FOZ63_026836 [Perkinsus olseni]|uniref:Uncharacterized protein n=1 Tax=Perkinsus olseni TaxID=32597 RepID=A0A7J6N4S0_PEROL|nr:hypothetical protein FOZ63_026836 [Perkinsus olseni]KAF4708113.1 hypothetical protein FOZ62_001898 [Perkinsus olseni]